MCLTKTGDTESCYELYMKNSILLRTLHVYPLLVCNTDYVHDKDRRNWILLRTLLPIPLVVTFSKALSKLKAQTSLLTETWQKRLSSFELRAFENDTPSGIGCTRKRYTREDIASCYAHYKQKVWHPVTCVLQEKQHFVTYTTCVSITCLWYRLRTWQRQNKLLAVTNTIWKTYTTADTASCYIHYRQEMLHPVTHTISKTYTTGDIACCYGVATVSRIDKIIGLFCKRDL